MRILSTITVAAVAALACGNIGVRAQETPSVLPALSSQAIEALVAGVAFYPDPVIERILDAAQYPDAIGQAAGQDRQAPTESSWPSSVRYLLDYPEILEQLDHNPELAAQLALAAQNQLPDVWAAIDQVRAQFEASQEGASSETESDSSIESAPGNVVLSGVVAYPTGAFVAGLWTAQVVEEIHTWYRAATAVPPPPGKRWRSMARPGPPPPGAARFNAMTAAHIRAANGLLASSWSARRAAAPRFSRPSPPPAAHAAPPASRRPVVRSPRRPPAGRAHSPTRRGGARRGRR